MGTVNVQLDRLTVVNKKDEIGKDEAYLWVIGLQVLTPGSDVDGLEFVRAKNPLPGNLGAGLKRKETRVVPAAIGRLQYPATPLGKRALFGVVVFAWDHDRTPNGSIQLAYDRTAATIDQAIRGIIANRLQVIQDEGLAAVKPMTPAEASAIRDAVEAEIRGVFLQSLGANAPWSLNLDDFVGAENAVATVADATLPFAQSFTLSLRKRDNIGAHYELSGSLRWTP